ncbi:DUF1992 domain-containing protein [Nocardia sp. NBC_01503]|uniref:DnaJ family domain-containing protein n=1 Tax=Nocardia sp. NBC_01503 TaxID=2975997 RepID=UPI002E7ABF29|nr:DUF1992 domain-containing protein [Nocardia sp. NBC_01503]WTL30032.1 DUF1992 domain-containing protein [Nocardia sp. NBC_01503]
MTERKPPDLTFESWIDRQIREATDRGEFDQLPGAGKPIPPGMDDENWWVRNLLQREGIGNDALLPEHLVLRRDRERIDRTVREMTSERAVREAVSELNERIVRWIRSPSGPDVPIGPVRADDVVAGWRAARVTDRVASTPTAAADTPFTDLELVAPQAKRSWWRRLLAD